MEKKIPAQQTIDEAKAAFKAPKYGGFGDPLPYALFWRPQNHYVNEQHHEIYDLNAVILRGHDGTPAGIRYLARKPNWRLVGYWVPEFDAKGQKENKYNEVVAEMEAIMGTTNTLVKELEEEKSALKKKIEALEAEVQAKDEEPKSKKLKPDSIQHPHGV